MSSSSVSSTSTAVVPYDHTLPHISIRAHLEKVTDEVFRRSFEITKFETRHLSPLDQNWEEKVVTEIACGLSHLYIDEEMGQRMAQVITRSFRHGNYNVAANPFTFKQLILQDLRATCPDKHLDLKCSPHSIPEYDPDRSLRTLEENELTAQQKDYLDLLNGDRPDFSKEMESYMIPNTQIGYFKINLFPSLEFPETRAIIDNAMKNIMGAESLIIDLRENSGGSPATVALVASYLFDKKQLINQVYQRSSNELTSFYVEPEKLSQCFGAQKPVCVLTSAQTFSGGEELAYDLQSTKRATVVGQATAGGAHPVRSYVVDDHFFVQIPHAKAINPLTGTNWEGIGVKPLPEHLIAQEADALAFARALLSSSLAFK